MRLTAGILLSVGLSHAVNLKGSANDVVLCHTNYDTYECETSLGTDQIEWGACEFFNNGRRVVKQLNDSHVHFELYHGSTCIGKPSSTLNVPVSQCLTDDFEKYCSTVNVFACTYVLTSRDPSDATRNVCGDSTNRFNKTVLMPTPR